MPQFTVEVDAAGHLEEVITAEDRRDAYDEVCTALNVPEWVDITIQSVEPIETVEEE